MSTSKQAQGMAKAKASTSGGGDKEGSTTVSSMVELVCLLLTAAVAFAIRLFSIVKYESVIHEFDPYFNYRVTQLASEKGKSLLGETSAIDDRRPTVRRNDAPSATTTKSPQTQI